MPLSKGAQPSSSCMQASGAKQNVPSFAYQRSGFLRAMSDAGLKPTVVHHNLTPAELYEQVQGPHLTAAHWKPAMTSRPMCIPRHLHEYQRNTDEAKWT